MSLKTKILSSLLFRANSETQSPYFYDIKKKILKKYGKHICYDVQFIEGKKCNTCNGTGIYVGYRWSGEKYGEPCYNCYAGWYKRPTWNILSRVEFCKYTFHQPFQRVYKKPDISTPIIDGYIEHKRKKCGSLSLTILFLLYEKHYLKRSWKAAGVGWRVYWWYPRCYYNNIAHLFRYGRNSYPALKIKEKIRHLIKEKSKCELDDLPF